MKLLKYLILSYLLFLNYSGAELVKADRYLTLENCRKTDTEELREIFYYDNGLNLKLNLNIALIFAIVSKGSNEQILALVKDLINSGATLNSREGKLKDTPLMYALKEKKFEVAKVLLQAGADINLANVHNITPLWLASSENNAEIVDLLIKKGANINAIDNTGGFSPLMIAAAKTNNPKIIKLLIVAGADLELKSQKNNWTALMFATINQKKNFEIAKLLIEAGAEVNLYEKEYNSTPLMLATQYSNNPKLIELLLQVGANKKAIDKNGKTALDIAKQNNNQELIKLLK